jgi:hypothetical protein
MPVNYANDADRRRVDLVVDGIRKVVQEETAETALDDRVPLRCFFDARHGSVQIVKKTVCGRW